MQRRFFLKGLIIATTAPAIVRASSLMPIVVPKGLDNLCLKYDPYYTPPEWTPGKSFWGFTNDDMETRRKLRALGIDENFLNGEPQWSSARVAMESHNRMMAEMRKDFPPETTLERVQAAMWETHDREVEFLRKINATSPIDDPIGDMLSRVTGVSKRLLFGVA